MVTKNWTGNLHLNKGALRRTTHTPAGKKIPVATLDKLAKGGGVTAKRARLALTFRAMKK